LFNVGIMKRLVTAVTAVALCSPPAALPAAERAAQPTAVGLWERDDSSGMPVAWFRILDCDGVYEGKIVRIFPKPGEDPSKWRCTECEGDQKNAPVIGITFIKGMRKNGLAYQGGSILDPRSGSVYNALMELSPDGQQLEVRGYFAIPLLGQSEMWKRIPANSLPPGRFASCSSSSPSRTDIRQ